MLSAKLRWRLKTHRLRALLRYYYGDTANRDPWYPADVLVLRAKRRDVYKRIQTHDDGAVHYWQKWLKRSITSNLRFSP